MSVRLVRLLIRYGAACALLSASLLNGCTLLEPRSVPTATKPAASVPTEAPLASGATPSVLPASAAPKAPAPANAASPVATTPAAALPPASGPLAVAPGPDARTAGQLGEGGREVFAQHCAVCHGAQGQGISAGPGQPPVAPVLIGPQTGLDKYGNGRGLYDYVQQRMPQTTPGSLSPEAYLEVVALVLVQNELVSPTALLDQASLAGVRLSR